MVPWPANDTPIDYPIVQKDENAYYIDPDWEAITVLPAVSSRLRIKIMRRNTLYGHNMGNGSMFHSVKSFTKRMGQTAHLLKWGRWAISARVASSVLNGEDGAAFDYWNRTTEPGRLEVHRGNTLHGLVWYAPDVIRRLRR
ncbi:MAG: hypothetical protein ACLTXT_06210 [Ruminococcus callidus]